MSTFYDLKADLPKGSYDFDQLKGKVVLVVNVASNCGYTPQYKGLQEMYERHKDKGFVILGFPSNQFYQETGSDDKIVESCQLNYGVSFPIMKKSDVNGNNTNEVFRYLKDKRPGIFGLTRIKWNFEKFLIDREGNVVERFSTRKTPEVIEKEVEKIL